MDPVVIYFKELEFNILQRFTLAFSQNNELKKIFFQQTLFVTLNWKPILQTTKI